VPYNLYIGLYHIFSGFTAAPTVVTPVVRVLPEFESKSDLYLGSVTGLELNVSFPVETTPDVIIELLPSTNETIMALGDVKVTHVGSKTGITMPPIVKYEADETKDVRIVLC